MLRYEVEMMTRYQKKAKQVILYVCEKTADAPGCGSVLFNKLLYFIDHTSYVKTGKTITGFSYIKQARGPTPAPSHFIPLIETMIEADEMRIEQTERFGMPIKRHMALVKPDIAKFTAPEIALMDEVISTFKDTTGTFASELSHDMLAFKIAAPMEEMPPFTYLLNESNLTETDLSWGKSKISEYKNAA
jgi:hypothetical protein